MREIVFSTGFYTRCPWWWLVGGSRRPPKWRDKEDGLAARPDAGFGRGIRQKQEMSSAESRFEVAGDSAGADRPSYRASGCRFGIARPARTAPPQRRYQPPILLAQNPRRQPATLPSFPSPCLGLRDFSVERSFLRRCQNFTPCLVNKGLNPPEAPAEESRCYPEDSC
ncbi:hypothetical protein FQN51_008231 [Onygenales sp. PD_10]|nr:hypothetical protein FQN51_008231 [Onygenales sp. PD_10]